MRTLCRRLVIVLVGLIVGLLPAVVGWAATVKGSFERTLKVSGPTQIDLETGAGDIHVRRGEPGVVQIRGRIQGDAHSGEGSANLEERVREIESHPPIEQDGNRIRIGHDVDSHLTRNISIDYDLTVPAETELSTHTGSGDLSVEDIKGRVDVESGSGDMILRALEGPVRVRTGSGDVKLEKLTGEDVDVQTGSGEVALNGVRSAVRVHTGSGDVDAEGAPTGSWSLTTGSGEVKVHLPEDAGVDLEAHTSSGEVSSSLPITLQGKMGHGELHGKLRGGGARVELRTGSGDIRID